MDGGTTIYALATGLGTVAMVRVSGPGAQRALACLTPQASLPPPRMAALRQLENPGEPDRVLDRALVLVFEAPASYTGEDVVELHLHGGAAVVESVLRALGTVEGLVPAAPGEFTRRAVLNGRMDLTAAEGVLDLINAQTAAQHRQALAQSAGALGALLATFEAQVRRALAAAEAGLDFPDEMDHEMASDDLGAIRDVLKAGRGLLARAAAHRRVREGLRVCIAGPPNAGKSTLLNAWVGSEAAIVHERSGTTRDVIEVQREVAGFWVTFVDTAGLHEASDPVEAEGIRRARAQLESADVRVWVTAADAVEAPPEAFDVVVVNKLDVAPAPEGLTGALKGACGISLHDGRGLEALEAVLVERLRVLAEVGEGPALTRERQYRAVSDCVAHLERALGVSWELRAEELRLALGALDRLTGRTDVESLLDEVFAEFCIGK